MNPESAAALPPSPQPEVEFIIFIDQCSFFNKQLGCIKALNRVAQAAGSGVKVSLGTTDQDFREKTDYRDPQHAEARISRSDIGFKFARFIFSNPDMVKFFASDLGRNFISVFQREVLQKELLGSDGNKGLLDIMEHNLVPYNRGSNQPVQALRQLGKSHPLARFKDLTYADLHEMENGLKKGMYVSLKSLKGQELLEELGIKNADDITVNMMRNFIQEQSPSFVLQTLVDSKHVYSTVVNTNKEFKKARNHAGERAVFEIEERLPAQLREMTPEKRAGFGKQVVLVHICDDGPAWEGYIAANGHSHPQESPAATGDAVPPANGSHAFMLIGAKGFVEFLQKTYNTLSVVKDAPEEFTNAVEELNRAKKELHTQMHKGGGPNGKNARRHTKPPDFQPEALFTRRIKDAICGKGLG